MRSLKAACACAPVLILMSTIPDAANARGAPSIENDARRRPLGSCRRYVRRARKSRPTPRGPARGASTITIVKASLGHNCGQRAGNFTRQVARSCNGKSNCQYKVPNQRRAGFCTYAFDVEYRCGRGPSQKAHLKGDAWAQPPARLTCGRTAGAGHPAARRKPPARQWRGGSGRISIVTASLGANCGQRRGNFTRQVARACNGKQSCQYRVPRQRRSGFCTYILDVEYRCGKGPTQKAHVPGDAWAKPPAQLSCPR